LWHHCLNLCFEKDLIIHFRRTDKKSEAKYYSIKEYFEPTERWFQIQERRSVGKTIKRRVYIATDEPDVINEARKQYS
jgi:glycoprotein 6-alpha-L-fucosyltransferase